MKKTLLVIGAWFSSGAVCYVFAALFSQLVVLNELRRLGLDISMSDNLFSLAHAVLNMVPYMIVILIGFAIAFGVASVVKQRAARLSKVAYPVAGAAAMGTALWIMNLRFGVFPILGAQETYGLILQISAGGLGGLAFERLRPKQLAS